MKKAAIIGGSGFIGSHVADSLTDAGYKVYVYDIKESPYLRENQEMVIGDILDTKKVEDITKNANAVYHFAALSDLDEGLNKPVHDLSRGCSADDIIHISLIAALESIAK